MSSIPHAAAPPVVTWFKVYAAIMCFLYLLVTGAGALFLVFPDALENEDAVGAWIIGGGLIVFGLVFLAVYGAAVILPPRPWVWILDIVLICLGFTSCLSLPFCIPLLIFWLKPETKAYFGRT